MLAPLIIELLIASLLMLLVGWISDVFHAGTHDDRSYVAFPIGRARPGRLARRSSHDSAT